MLKINSARERTHRKTAQNSISAAYGSANNKETARFLFSYKLLAVPD